MVQMSVHVPKWSRAFAHFNNNNCEQIGVTLRSDMLDRHLCYTEISDVR